MFPFIMFFLSILWANRNNGMDGISGPGMRGRRSSRRLSSQQIQLVVAMLLNGHTC